MKIGKWEESLSVSKLAIDKAKGHLRTFELSLRMRKEGRLRSKLLRKSWEI
jgi:hypothetical protein